MKHNQDQLLEERQAKNQKEISTLKEDLRKKQLEIKNLTQSLAKQGEELKKYQALEKQAQDKLAK